MAHMCYMAEIRNICETVTENLNEGKYFTDVDTNERKE
jgi:hypothetical protein